MLCPISNVHALSSPTSRSKTVRRQDTNRRMDKRSIFKELFFCFKIVPIQATCQKCFQAHLAGYKAYELDWELGPSKSRASTTVHSCSKHLKHSFQTETSTAGGRYFKTDFSVVERRKTTSVNCLPLSATTIHVLRSRSRYVSKSIPYINRS
jgi:hypothetical protein